MRAGRFYPKDSRKVNLKYNYPLLIFALVFGAAVYFSFKHKPAPEPQGYTAASAQERQDQISLSAMHAEPAPAAISGAAPRTGQGINASIADLAQLRILDQILAAKNDNDPRLDHELRMLTPAAKALMRDRYTTTAVEKRNQRGTIVYLLGREMSSSDDVAFMHSVLSEPACLSLKSCGTEDNASMTSDDHHHDGVNEVTLSYPQIVALKSIESYLNQPAANPLSPQLLAEIESASRSPIRKVASMAEEISRQYHSRHP